MGSGYPVVGIGWVRVPLGYPSRYCGRASQGCAERRSDTVRSGNKGKSEGRSGKNNKTQHTTYCIEQTLL
jgi:hypothetical protein